MSNVQPKSPVFVNVFNNALSTFPVCEYGTLVPASSVTSGTDNYAVINAACAAAEAAGGGIVWFPAGLYLTSPLPPRTNVTIKAAGSRSTQLGAIGNASVFQGDQTVALGGRSFAGMTFDSIGFVGPVSSSPTVPTRARTTSGAGTTTAISFDGSLDTNGTYPLITDVAIVNCTFQNCSSLPVRLFGISGVVRFSGNESINNLDVGIGFSADVICSDNYVKNSADNGMSLSRGNLNVTCTGNTVLNSCYSGIFVSGSAGQVGPRGFTVTGNVVTGCGYACIMLQTAPKFGTVTGNILTQGYNRGPIDGLNDVFCTGIYLESDSGVTVTGNTIFQAPRAGIYSTLCTGVSIADNLMYNVGTTNLAGTTGNNGTAIASTDQTQNCGIIIESTNPGTEGYVVNNRIIDERGASNLTNYGVTPTVITTRITVSGNSAYGMRQPSPLAHVDSSQNGACTFAVGAQASAAVAGSNGANDQAAEISVTTVSSPAAGALVTVTFSAPYAAVPRAINVSAGSAAAAAANVYVSAKSTTGYTLSAASAPPGATALPLYVSVVQ